MKDYSIIKGYIVWGRLSLLYECIGKGHKEVWAGDKKPLCWTGKMVTSPQAERKREHFLDE